MKFLVLIFALLFSTNAWSERDYCQEFHPKTGKLLDMTLKFTRVGEAEELYDSNGHVGIFRFNFTVLEVFIGANEDESYIERGKMNYYIDSKKYIFETSDGNYVFNFDSTKHYSGYFRQIKDGKVSEKNFICRSLAK